MSRPTRKLKRNTLLPQDPEKIAARKKHYFWHSLPDPPPNTLSHHKQPWSEEDNEILREYYTTHGTEYTAAILGRTSAAVRGRAQQLQVPGFDSGRLERIAEQPSASVKTSSSPAPTLNGKERPFYPTANQRATIRRLLGRKSFDEIAEMYSATEDEIRQIARADGSLPVTIKHPWSRKEDTMLRKLWGKESHSRIARRLHRSVYAVRKRAAELGINVARRVWTPKEDALMRKLYGRLDNSEIAKRLDRSRDAVIARAYVLGVNKPGEMSPMWSEKQDEQLRELYGPTPLEELAQMFGRSVTAIYMRVGQLRLTHPHWQPWEEKLLDEFYGTVHIREIAQRLNRSVGGVRARVTQLGLAERLTKGSTRWNRANDEKLRRLYGTMPPDELAKAVGCSRYRLPYHLQRLGLIGRALREWSDEEISYLRKTFPTTPSAEIAAKLNCSVDSLRKKAKRLGLRRVKEKKNWTKEEVEYLRNAYPARPLEEIARKLDRTVVAIKVRAGRLKLRRTEELPE